MSEYNARQASAKVIMANSNNDKSKPASNIQPSKEEPNSGEDSQVFDQASVSIVPAGSTKGMK